MPPSSKPSNPLDKLTQVIHLSHLRPPVQLLVRSTFRGGWEVKLFALFEGSMRIWECQMHDADRIKSSKYEAIADAIKSGMLHIDLGGEKSLIESGYMNEAEQELHFLGTDGQAIVKLPIHPEEATGMEADELLGLCFELLARPVPVKADKAEIRGLHADIAKKDEEISHLQTKLASLKATVVRATASDNNRKKVQASPKKPANASALQPNAKRRKAVEDEFAGSDSE